MYDKRTCNNETGIAHYQVLLLEPNHLELVLFIMLKCTELEFAWGSAQSPLAELGAFVDLLAGFWQLVTNVFIYP